MPRFDGTGPMGQGPMTGGGRGFCALPEGTRPSVGYGVGRGGIPWGGGRGRVWGGGRLRWWSRPYPAVGPASAPQAGHDDLLARLDALASEMAELRAQVQRISSRGQEQDK